MGPQALETKFQVDANTDPLSVKEELVCDPLQELDPYESMGPDIIQPRVLKRTGQCHWEASLHNLWEVMEAGGQPSRLEEG